MSHQVLKLLFKTFLRWNRQTHIRNSEFSINLTSLGLGRYVPPDHSPVIRKHEGVQGALFHIFRLPPPIIPVKQNNTNNDNNNNNDNIKSRDTSSFLLTKKIINNDIRRGHKPSLSTVDARQDDIQLGFQVLRELNIIGSVILKNYNQKIERLKYCYPDLNDDIDNTVHHHPPNDIHKNDTIHKDDDDITAESSSSSSSLVKYRVGQTIQHKVSKIRGVVTGWDIDEETKTQRIEILLDQLDFNHWIDSSLVHSVMSSKSLVRLVRRVVHVPISDVTLVTDNNMKRILNEDIKFFFNGYSSLLNRYIPNKDLSFWYSHDMDYFNSQFESHMVIRNHEGNVYKNALENVHSSLSSITSSIQNVFDRHFYSGNSMITHLNALPTQNSHQQSLISSSSLSKPILSKHFNPSSLNNPSMTSVSSRSSPTSSATTSSTVEVLTDAQINMKFITDNILDEVRSYMTGFTKAMISFNSHTHSTVSSTSIKSATTKPITTTDYKDSYIMKDFHRKVIMKNSSVEGNKILKSLSNLESEEQLTQHSKYDVNEIFNAVGYLVNCFHAVDQLLQLRFQAKGMGYIDGLVVKSMNRPSSSSSSPASPPSSRRSHRYQNSKWRLHKPSGSDAASASSSSPSLSIPSTSLQSSSFFNYHHEIHDVPSRESDGYCDTINEESKHPPALYQVGQVVRHKIHGYHSVIIGFEQVVVAYICLY